MIFVISSNYASSELRGMHIAHALGVPCYFSDLKGARNGDVVFVKDAPAALAYEAKSRGNRIILDVIDLYCYGDRRCEFAEIVDILIVPNRACIAWYAPHFPRARYAVIPHQWDARITGSAQQERFVPGYIGKKFNFTLPQFAGEKIFAEADQLAAAKQFNLHIALQKREEHFILLKPATKVSTAAAVGANALAYRDPSAMELLGTEYPFYVDDDPMAALEMAQASFGGPTWKRGLEIMAAVREKTSLKTIADLYRRLANDDLAEAA